MFVTRLINRRRAERFRNLPWSTWVPWRRLLVIAAYDSASRRVDEMHLPARLAVHRLIGHTGLIGPIVRDPALDVKARVRAAEQEWRHSSASQRSKLGA